MKKKRRTVMLTLTHSCNLNCIYCYEGNKSSDSMEISTVLAILERELNKEDTYDEVEIDFFGGEPFIKFDMIREIVSYVTAKDWKHDYIFFAVTNGTLIHGEVKEWLIDNREHFVCGLSYDGTIEMQNMNRDNSAGMIDLDFFYEQYSEQPIKMTVSQQSLKSLAKGVIELQKRGFEVSCNLAYGIDWSDKENERILTEQLNELIEYYLEHPEETPCSMLDMGIETDFDTKQSFRFCGCGVSVGSYDVDGELYPCHMFMPLSAGQEKAEKSSSIVFYKNSIPEELIDDKCKNCIIKISCPTCYGSNYISFGDIYKHENNYCKLTKAIMKARSYFKGKQWELGQIKLDEEEEHRLLANIINIQENL